LPDTEAHQRCEQREIRELIEEAGQEKRAPASAKLFDAGCRDVPNRAEAQESGLDRSVLAQPVGFRMEVRYQSGGRAAEIAVPEFLE
jgi:hypothetical protein